MLERQRVKENVSKVGKVLGRGSLSNMYVHPGEKICITRSENKMKKILAFELSRFIGAPSRSCEFSGSLDVNSKKIYNHLKTVFSDYTWYYGQSQGKFDVYSYDAAVAIEVKTVKRGQSKLIFNATVYPDVISKTKVGKEVERLCEPPVVNVENIKGSSVTMDVLVLCVERDPKNNTVYNYAIVDGTYWNIKEKDYDSCEALYNDINDPMVLKEIMNVVYKRKGNRFARRIRDGEFGNNFKLRKLISLENPVGKMFK